MKKLLFILTLSIFTLTGCSNKIHDIKPTTTIENPKATKTNYTKTNYTKTERQEWVRRNIYADVYWNKIRFKTYLGDYIRVLHMKTKSETLYFKKADITLFYDYPSRRVTWCHGKTMTPYY